MLLYFLIFHSVLSEYSPVLPRSCEAVRAVVVAVVVVVVVVVVVIPNKTQERPLATGNQICIDTGKSEKQLKPEPRSSLHHVM